ncbi:MAG: efflux RND transporter periplasmic adaptor subunit [Verrucomicrobiales bacterium]|nr:efflux RND transporter periplasmic adaptor subunit [Verrucomicrobiales bacterium]MCP5560459.1 efflux RND transporter periplasmic adaptor subunit [Verrucomicrobiaceae bacterium]
MKIPTHLLLLATFAVSNLRAEEGATELVTEVEVQVAKVVKVTLHQTITAFGVIEPDPLASAKLSPATAGLITVVNGIEGQQVKKGDVLFRLDSRAVDAAEATAELAIQFSQANVDRQKALIEVEGTSAKQLLEAEQALAAAKAEVAAAKVQQSLMQGEAPMNGTLVKFDAKPGEAADASRVLAEIIDLDRLVANVRIPIAEASEIRADQIAQLISGTDATPIEGKVIFISPQVDPATDTVLVRISVPKKSTLRPGQFIRANIVSAEHKDRLAVPLKSLVNDPEDGPVISLVTDGIATRKAVKTGFRDAQVVEVEAEGLSEGQTVVTFGTYGLPHETKVRITTADSK